MKSKIIILLAFLMSILNQAADKSQVSLLNERDLRIIKPISAISLDSGMDTIVFSSTGTIINEAGEEVQESIVETFRDVIDKKDYKNSYVIDLDAEEKYIGSFKETDFFGMNNKFHDGLIKRMVELSKGALYCRYGSDCC
jgi:hypothetical protein